MDMKLDERHLLSSSGLLRELTREGALLGKSSLLSSSELLAAESNESVELLGILTGLGVSLLDGSLLTALHVDASRGDKTLNLGGLDELLGNTSLGGLLDSLLDDELGNIVLLGEVEEHACWHAWGTWQRAWRCR